MPKMDGNELCRRISSDRRLASLPVIVHSSVDVPLSPQSAWSVFLRKPCPRTVLLKRYVGYVRKSASRASPDCVSFETKPLAEHCVRAVRDTPSGGLRESCRRCGAVQTLRHISRREFRKRLPEHIGMLRRPCGNPPNTARHRSHV
jgi:DNA-binding response OmpR family regulator